MNEYSLQKQKMTHDKHQQQQRRNKQPIGNPRSKTHIGAGQTYSKEFAQINYRDADMRRLATEGKGTTSAHSYQ